VDDLYKALGLGRFFLNKASYWTHTDGTKWWHNPETNRIEPYTEQPAGNAPKEEPTGTEQAPAPVKNVFQGLPQTFPPAPRGKSIAYGGIVLDEAGENILMRKVAGSYGGYVWTYAKGRQDPGEDPTVTAIREVREELGINGKIHGTLPKWYEGDTSATAFYVMQQQGEAFPHDKETETTKWIPLGEAEKYINKTTSSNGKRRDLSILEDIRKLVNRK